MFKKFERFYETEMGGGSPAGKLELSKLSLAEAQEHATKVFRSFGRELYTEIPNFDKNFLLAQAKFKLGHTKRQNMPVITTQQVRLFQASLLKGKIDFVHPFSKNTDIDNPLPTGLSGHNAELFLQNGLSDGSKTDDMVAVYKYNGKIGDLNPIQEQVYFDKSIWKIARNGAGDSRNYLSKAMLVLSKDKYIIDGHHRFLTGLLIDQNIIVQGVKIDLDINTLQQIALAYGDAIGNKRNK